MSSNFHFCVIGLGKSGYSAAMLLRKRDIKVKVTEVKENISLKRRRKILEKIGVEVELGKHTPKFYQDASIYVTSPGVPESNPVLRYAKENNIPVISEIELAWMFSRAKIIAITGTNGKTSVSTYCYQILKKAGFSVYLAGNIGIPFSDIVLDLSSTDLVVLEVSSFQLERIFYFRPDIAVLLNVSCDHLDRYKNFEEYLSVKFNLFKNQTPAEVAILDLSQDVIAEKRKTICSRIVDVSKFNLPQLDLNKKFVYAIGRVLGIEKDSLLSRIKKLKSLKHRMEELGCVNGIRFINDSKATNPDATRWALRNLDSNIILIAGGRDKNMDFRILKQEVSLKVKALILLGETKDKILSQLGGFVEVVKLASDLEEAVRISFQQARRGDTVLLSPMCASFDMFKNYEERGDRFRDIVRSLKECKN